MAEYIDLDTPLELYVGYYGGLCKKQISTLRDLLDTNRIPYTAADVVERKTGKWIDVDDYIISGSCSACGWQAHLYEDDVVGMNFCPNCGADMRGREMNG